MSGTAGLLVAWSHEDARQWMREHPEEGVLVLTARSSVARLMGARVDRLVITDRAAASVEDHYMRRAIEVARRHVRISRARLGLLP